MELGKYPAKTDTTARPRFTRWEDSADVLRLVEYLGINPDLGARLCWNNGAPSLVFDDPPLTGNDFARLLKADVAVDLMQIAVRDLRQLHESGLLVLPASPHQGEGNGNINHV